MKNSLLLLVLFWQFSLGVALTVTSTRSKQATKQTTAKKQESPKVYICNGGSAYAYHSTDGCSGLNRCSHTISAVNTSESVNSYGRRPCKKCY